MYGGIFYVNFFQMSSLATMVKEMQCEHYETTTIEVQMFLNQFYQQLTSQPVVFSAAGFFDFDLPLLSSILTGVVSYQLIFLQFHISSKN